MNFSTIRPINNADLWGLMSDLDLAIELMRNYILPFRSDPFTNGAEVVKRQYLVKSTIANAMEAYAAAICNRIPKSPMIIARSGLTFMNMGTVLSYANRFFEGSKIACQDSFWMLHTLNGATGFDIVGQFVARRQCNKCEVYFMSHNYTFLDRADMHWKYSPDFLIKISNFFNIWHWIGVMNQEYDIEIGWQDSSMLELKYNESYVTKWSPTGRYGWPFN